MVVFTFATKMHVAFARNNKSQSQTYAQLDGYLGCCAGPRSLLSMTYIHVGGALEAAFAITVSPFLLTEELWPPTEREQRRLEEGN